jgi:hypothetical protein
MNKRLLHFILLATLGAGAAFAQDTNSVANGNAIPDWSTFQSIANKNIFDPNRSGGSYGGPRRRAPVVRTFTFCGVIDDVAIFKGDGVSSDGFLRAGDSVNGFKVMKIPAAYSENPEIKMTDPSGAIVALQEGQSMRREGEGSWDKSEQQASESSSSSDSSTSSSSDNSSSSTPAASAPEPAGVSDILARLRARHKQQDQ